MNSQIFLPPRIYADDGEPTLLTDALEILVEEGWSDWHEKSVFTKNLALIGELLPEHIEFLADWFKEKYSLTVRKAGESHEPDETTIYIYSKPSGNMPCFELAGWGIFEFVDYLRQQGFDYERVMKIVVTLDTTFAGGAPRIWGPVLEYLARKVESNSILPEPLTVFDLLSDLITDELDEDLHFLNSFLDSLISSRREVPLQRHFGDIPSNIEFILRNEDARMPFLARRIVERLRLGDPEVIQTWLLAATDRWLEGHLRGDEEAKQYILKDYEFEQSNVAAHWSLLLLCDPDWHPVNADSKHATRANLTKANWGKLTANSAIIDGTNLEHADLSHSTFECCNFNGVDFTLADLSSTSMGKCNLRSSLFHFAKFSRANIDSCTFYEAQLQDAILTETMIKESQFPGCNFTGANMTFLIAKSCDFRKALLIEVELDNARLEQCRLDDLDLRTVMFEGATLRQCKLSSTNFEDVRLDCEFSDCDFSSSLLTGSVASGIVLRDCNFSLAGMADIEWTNCDLRGAKFIASAFHLGSTRCGTLDSPYPSHGTRTGYYTDDYEDLHFKNPESIRKAALVDCDLRGAVLDKTDFYLVDLRGSKYDSCYESHLQRCGAILDE